VLTEEFIISNTFSDSQNDRRLMHDVDLLGRSKVIIKLVATYRNKFCKIVLQDENHI
jgi:hypothetical protein